VGWARRNARALHLERGGRNLESEKPRYSFRVTRDGQLAVDIIARFIQGSQSAHPRGVTVIAGADGNIRYVIPNQPLPKLKRASAEAETDTAKALSPSPEQPRAVNKPPFPARYRLPAAKYYKAYPHLRPRAAELKQLREVVGEPHLP
jgi:hypothetical protein